MQKRKALDSGSIPNRTNLIPYQFNSTSEVQLEHKKHVVNREEHIDIVVDASEKGTVSVLETDMEVKTCATDIPLKEDVPSTSMPDIRGPSSDILPLPTILDKEMIRERDSQEKLNNTINLPAKRETTRLSEVADAYIPKQCNEICINSKQYKSYHRRAKNKDSATGSIAQPSLPSVQYYNSGDTSSSLTKISDQKSLENKNMSSVEKDKSDLTGGACGKSDDDGVLCGSNTKSGIDGSISTDSREDDISDSGSTISFEMASNPAECPSPPGLAQGRKADPEKVLQDCSVVTEGCISCHSEEGDASKEVITLKDREKHAILERKGSNDELALVSEDFSDESSKVQETTGISAEENLRAHSPDCKEPLSPIRGVIGDSASLCEPNNKNLLNSFKKEEVNFSFQTEEKVLIGDPTSEKLCDTGANGLPSIQKEDELNNMPCCVASETSNCGANKVTTESVLSLDSNNFEVEKLEAVTVETKRNLVTMRRKLLVLDLNGLLADIIVDNHNAHRTIKRVAGKSVFKRPFCDDFLKFCFNTFDIGVWSSRRKYNVDSAIDYIMGDNKHKLLFSWDQSQCTYTGFKTLENFDKPLVLKELKKLWDKEEKDLPWEKGDYSPANTLLVDDSPYKALCNPPYTSIFPHPYHFNNENDTSLGPGGELRVYLEGLAVADDVRLYVQEHPFGQRAITNRDPSWDFYHRVIVQASRSLAPRR